jgi:hypothetical protein
MEGKEPGPVAAGNKRNMSRTSTIRDNIEDWRLQLGSSAMVCERLA